MIKIYDCFSFFNELDLLEMRLNILNDYVDYFVIVESSITHSGNIKPYYFDINKDMFSEFLHKIIHIKIDDMPDDFENLNYINTPISFDDICKNKIFDFIKNTNRFDRRTQKYFGRDFYQKESVRRGLGNCGDYDMILFSDCDEIPNPNLFNTFNILLDTHKFISLSQTTYYYYLNVLKEHGWKGTKIARYKDIIDYSFNELRCQEHYVINNGGWHFSYMGGYERVKTKIESFSHQEMFDINVINNIKNNIENNIDPFFRGTLKKVDIDHLYPTYILNNLEKYKYMIKQ